VEVPQQVGLGFISVIDNTRRLLGTYWSIRVGRKIINSIQSISILNIGGELRQYKN
jgi:hypothetical protein